MGRTVIVGDVHGCVSELEDLLDRVRFASTDSLVFVGDLVAKGPASQAVLAEMKRLGGESVLGNHENKLLAWRRHGVPLGREHAPLAESLTDDEWRLLEAMPLWIDLPKHGARVIHGGVVPGIDVERCPPEALLTMRTIAGKERWSSEPDAGPLWGSAYKGPPHIVFGHNARAEPQLHPWATGLDTGCVYGGTLTALVLDDGEPVPRGSAARARLESCRARRSYFVGKGSVLAR